MRLTLRSPHSGKNLPALVKTGVIHILFSELSINKQIVFDLERINSNLLLKVKPVLILRGTFTLELVYSVFSRWIVPPDNIVSC